MKYRNMGFNKKPKLVLNTELQGIFIPIYVCNIKHQIIGRADLIKHGYESVVSNSSYGLPLAHMPSGVPGHILKDEHDDNKALSILSVSFFRLYRGRNYLHHIPASSEYRSACFCFLYD